MGACATPEPAPRPTTSDSCGPYPVRWTIRPTEVERLKAALQPFGRRSRESKYSARINSVMIMTALALTLAPPAMRLGPADIDAAFRAAGFAWHGRAWRSDCEDVGNPSYMSGRLEQVGDLNGDGRPEAVITEGSTMCFGNTGTRFAVVSKQPHGRWRRMIRLRGIPRILRARGSGRWPDIELGIPGMCTPVYRWNGREYQVHRFSRAEAPHCRLGR